MLGFSSDQKNVLFHLILSPICFFMTSNLVQQIAQKINRIIREQGLKDIGQLEQDLVFGDAGTKEVINYLRTHEVECLAAVVSMTRSILVCIGTLHS